MSDMAAAESLPPGPTAPPSVDQAEPVYAFKDPARLSNWLMGTIAFAAVVGTVSVYSNWLQLEFLWNLQAGAYEQPVLTTLAEQSDDRQQIVAAPYFVAIITNIVLFCFWIPRVARNARALGAKGMKISPRWAVGWYFIPLANLLMPYRAMKEIWKASKAPAAWEAVKRGRILPWWWALFIISNTFGNMEMRLTLNAKTLPELVTSTQVSIVSDVAHIIASLAAIALVGQIRNMQAVARAAAPVGT